MTPPLLAIDPAFELGPEAERRRAARLRPLLRDEAGRARADRALARPPVAPEAFEPTVSLALEELDRRGVERAMIQIDESDALASTALASHPDRFFAAADADPHGGVAELARLERLKRDHDLAAISVFPAGLAPQLPIDDKKLFPLYAKCVELDVALIVSAGVPSWRVPMAAQHVERLDPVCWFFPELTLVMRDGAEPWLATSAALLRQWPGLHYLTNRHAPAELPTALLDVPGKLLWGDVAERSREAGAIARELAASPLPRSAWPGFLRGNAARVFGLEEKLDSGDGLP